MVKKLKKKIDVHLRLQISLGTKRAKHIHRQILGRSMSTFG